MPPSSRTMTGNALPRHRENTWWAPFALRPPRTFTTTISGSPHQDAGHETNDISSVGIDRPGYGPGFDLWVGGGLTAAREP
ncbi:MAG: hypothetical protein QG622_3659 [Actinomycetota bacterium]|nr:hypothetical protein [Actinomycetota bacterium]